MKKSTSTTTVEAHAVATGSEKTTAMKKRSRSKRSEPTSYALPLSNGLNLLGCFPGDEEMMADLSAEIVARHPGLFRMGKNLVQVTCVREGEFTFKQLDKAGLAEIIKQHVILLSLPLKADTDVTEVSHESLAQRVLSHRLFDHFQILRGIVLGPMTRQDGTAIEKAGYDCDSQLFMLNPDADLESCYEEIHTGDEDMDRLLNSLF